MCRGGRVYATASAVAAFIVCCVCVCAGPAMAGDDDDATVILFSGRDIWRNGAFAYGGLLLAPGGVDNDGFNLKMVLSGGVYRYTASNAAGNPPGSITGWDVIGVESTVQVLPGFRVKRGNLEVKVFFGPDFEYHRLYPDDPSNHLRGHSWGLRFASEFWYEPTPSTMIAGDATLASASTNYGARLAYGWLVLDQFYLGPETQYYGGDGYRQIRLGGHLTALKTGTNEWSVAGGWARDSDGRFSPYARMGMTVRQ
jgi:hypothetical protein